MTKIKPYVEEEKVMVELTKTEALAIQELRKFSYGQIIIHKANGKVIRVAPNTSKLIKEDQELTIPIVQ